MNGNGQCEQGSLQEGLEPRDASCSFFSFPVRSLSALGAPQHWHFAWNWNASGNRSIKAERQNVDHSQLMCGYMMDSFCPHRCALPNQGLCSQSLPKLQISNLRCCKTWHLNSLEHSFLRAFWGLKQICRSQDFRQSWWGHQLPLLQSDLFPATIQEIASDCSPLGANQAACSVMAQRGFDTWQSLHGVWWILKDKGCFLCNKIHFLDIQWNNMKYMQQEVTRSDYKSN